MDIKGSGTDRIMTEESKFLLMSHPSTMHSELCGQNFSRRCIRASLEFAEFYFEKEFEQFWTCLQKK